MVSHAAIKHLENNHVLFVSLSTSGVLMCVFSPMPTSADIPACTNFPCVNGTSTATCEEKIGGPNSLDGRTCSCPAGFFYSVDGATEVGSQGECIACLPFLSRYALMLPT